MKSPITNTTSQNERDPQGALAEFMVMGTGNAIEASERRGQRELVSQSGDTCVLPSDGSANPELAGMGIVFGELVEGDPMFRKATLPSGWALKPTDHSMWSKLVDETGKERASIFYKAALYDRSARITPIKA